MNTVIWRKSISYLMYLKGFVWILISYRWCEMVFPNSQYNLPSMIWTIGGPQKHSFVEGENDLGQKQKWLQINLTNRLNPCTWWWCRWTCSRCCCWCWNLLSTYPDISSGIFSPHYFFSWNQFHKKKFLSLSNIIINWPHQYDSLLFIHSFT